MYAPAIALFIVLPLMVMVIPRLINVWLNHKRRAALMAAASSLGLASSAEGEEGLLIRGVYAGYAIQVGRATIQREGADAALSALGAAAGIGKNIPNDGSIRERSPLSFYVFLQRELPRGLRVMRAGDARVRPPREGLERVKLGIQSFDTMLVIEAEDAAATRALFAQPATREAVAGLMVEGHSFALDQGHLTLTVGQLPTPEALAKLLDQLVRAASLLDGVAEQPGAGLLNSFEAAEVRR